MDVVRIALLSSPRSGNTWLRQMLAQVLDLSEQAVHRPEQVCWQALPERYILQLHWPPEPAFLSQLQEHGFRAVVLARHPLDVLISILAFCQHNATDDWLGGAGGDEKCLAGSFPLSEEFVDYATGPRASALLAVSADWWQLADVCRLRYEDLCLDAAGQMSALLSSLKMVPRRSLAEVIDGNSAENLRAKSVHLLYHLWQARPGIWREMLTPAVARRICEKHQAILSRLGYVCDPNESLESTEAQHAWERIDAAALKRSVNGVKGLLAALADNQKRDTEVLRAEVAHLREALQQARASQIAMIEQAERRQESSLAEQQAALNELSRQLAQVPWQQLRELSELGPWSVGAARTLQRWSGRFPRASHAFKSLVTLVLSLFGGAKASQVHEPRGPS